MKHWITGALAIALTGAGLITAAPPAGAGCQYGGLVASKCDGPVQPDGTWQRCVVITTSHSAPAYQWNPDCKLMGPDQHPLGIAYNDPPTHIDD
jgi:hypothetical protein